MRLVSEFAAVDQPVGTSLAALARTYDVGDVDELTLQIKNVGANALTAFEVRGRAIKDARLANLPLKSSTFTVPDAIALFASAEPATLGAGASVLLRINCVGLAFLELAAQAGTATNLNIAAGGYA